MGLLGHKDHAEAAFADLLQELVRADNRAGAFSNGIVHGCNEAGNSPVERSLRFRVATEESLHSPPQLVLIPAGRVQIGRPLVGHIDGKRRVENGFFFGECLGHGSLLPALGTTLNA